MSVKSANGSFGTTGGSRLIEAYQEDVFRYLLDKERRRAEHARRPILLLLVSVKTDPGQRARIPAAAAASIFFGLRSCVREVDFTGWFREDRVAGVILPQGADPLPPEVPRRIGLRTARALTEHVPSIAAGRLHVRVLQLRSAKTRQTT